MEELTAIKVAKTIAITGGAGYIGSSLATKLSKFYKIKLLDIREPTVKFNNDVNFERCDITDYEKLKRLLNDVDLVMHASIIQIPTINDQKRLAFDVNVIGTQNVCKAVDESKQAKGLILSGSWHTIGEKELKGVINEEFGFRPDKVEDRARLYVLSKMAQEAIVRFYDEMTPKIFGIIRMGTVLGDGMPEKTAANIFIENGILKKPLTPYKNSMYRPMLYADINDICLAYEKFAEKIIDGKIVKGSNSALHILNVYCPQPITIIELAELSKEAIRKESKGTIDPEIRIVDTGQPSIFSEKGKNLISVDATKAIKFLEIERLKSPKESIEELVKVRLSKLSK
jgi:UDP-glucose 4-epimerase